jgi:hypothetical protein
MLRLGLTNSENTGRLCQTKIGQVQALAEWGKRVTGRLL